MIVGKMLLPRQGKGPACILGHGRDFEREVPGRMRGPSGSRMTRAVLPSDPPVRSWSSNPKKLKMFISRERIELGGRSKNQNEALRKRYPPSYRICPWKFDFMTEKTIFCKKRRFHPEHFLAPHSSMHQSIPRLKIHRHT